MLPNTIAEKLNEAGVKALNAAGLYWVIAGGDVPQAAYESYAETAADYAYDAARLLRETGIAGVYKEPTS